MKTFLSISLLGFTLSLSTTAALVPVGKTIDYKDSANIALEGFLANPKAKGKHPAVIIVHEWMGLGSYAKKRAQMVAELGYVAFAADIYGKGIRAKNNDEAATLATKYKTNRPLLQERVKAAFDYVSKLPNVDANKIAVIGYCFGGTTALELARSGAPVLGTISFHGGLSNPTPENAKNIRGKVLVLHGADDPYVNPEEVNAFVEEMKKAKVDWQMVQYSGTVHSFTNWEVPMVAGAGAGYNELSDKRSWEAMKVFFHEIF